MGEHLKDCIFEESSSRSSYNTLIQFTEEREEKKHNKKGNEIQECIRRGVSAF